MHHVQVRLHTYLQRLGDQYTRSVAQLPRWRHPLVGYLVGLLLVGLGLAMGLVETQLLSPFSFPGVPLLFAIVLVALFWGVGPAIFALLLSLLVLDYLYVPPSGTLGTYGWDGMLQLFTFAAAGITIAVLATQREAARLRAIMAEREAVLRARQLEAIFEAMSDSVVVYNHQGKVLQTNKATRHLFGIPSLPVQDQVQREQELLLQAVQRDEQGQLLPEKRQPLSRLLKGEVFIGSKAPDVLVSTPDGRKVMLNMSGAPIRSETGGITGAVLISRDVTERRRLEQRTAHALQALLTMAQVLVQFPERLRHDEEASSSAEIAEQVGQRFVELTASVVESMHVIMLAVEPEEDVVSPIASVGLTPLQEQQWRERLARSPYLVDHIGDEMLIAELKNDEVLLLDGMSLPLYTHVLPYYVRTVLVAPICVKNRLVGLLCVDDGSCEHTYTAYESTLVRTISRLVTLILARAHLQREYAEARANELALREANRRMEAFLSMICHELKAPLTVMRGSLQLAERKVKRLVSLEAPVPAELRRFASVQALLERAQSQIVVQDRLVNDLLDVSRIQAQTRKLFMVSCNLACIVQEAVEDQQQIAPSRTIRLQMPVEQEVPVLGDANRLVQVMTNYLSNALKYSPPDRSVDVCLRLEGRMAHVAIRDEGPGLPPNECERIWERFYHAPGIEVQSESGVSHVGLGVGLHLCRTIIEQHGGQVGVQSSPSKGSTFWFTLPLEEQGGRDEDEEDIL
jgi:PAS domain S-box-containing protein